VQTTLVNPRSSHWLLALIFLSAFILPAFSQTQTDAVVKRAIAVRVPPVYPPLAQNMALHGVVKIEAIVASDGSVKAVVVKGGHPVLAQAAANAVRQWKWEPAAREIHEAVEVKFSLTE
jgi:TonB family protein